MDSTQMWIAFGILVLIMFILDLGVFNRGSHRISVRKALLLTVFWISVALAFAGFIYIEMGAEKTMEYLAGYAVEKMMSVDNLFVFLVIFAYFQVPDESQHKALYYGIVGAIAFRALFIVAGVELLNRFDVLMIFFGILLIYTAIKTVMKKEDGDPEKSLAMRLSKRLRSSPDFDGDKLFTVKNGVRMMTPLMVCIIVIELTDIMFAFDSIPAVLAITTDTFIVYSSNIFAILGLRALYFALKGAMGSLEYLKYGLGVILCFVGAKMIGSYFHYHMAVEYSLLIIVSILLITVMASMVANKRKAKGTNAQ